MRRETTYLAPITQCGQIGTTDTTYVRGNLREMMLRNSVDVSATSTYFKGVTAKMWLSLSISGHTLVMESLKLDPRVKAFKEEKDSNNLTLGPSLGDSITKVWPDIERLSHIFAVTPFRYVDAGGAVGGGLIVLRGDIMKAMTRRKPQGNKCVDDEKCVTRDAGKEDTGRRPMHLVLDRRLLPEAHWLVAVGGPEGVGGDLGPVVWPPGSWGVDEGKGARHGVAGEAGMVTDGSSIGALTPAPLKRNERNIFVDASQRLRSHAQGGESKLRHCNNTIKNTFTCARSHENVPTRRRRSQTSQGRQVHYDRKSLSGPLPSPSLLPSSDQNASMEAAHS